MTKRTVSIIVGLVLLASPVVALAATGNTDQLVALYTQLVQILEQELAVLAGQSASLSITPTSGTAPLSVTFTVLKPTGAEAIDYGDGHSTGSSGCKMNAQNYCDLSQPVSHTYALPGTYTVKLYEHTGKDATVVATATVTVTAH